jgi:hypothetical protein
MRTKQRKSLPWRRFGYVMLIVSIKFCHLLLWFSPRIINGLSLRRLYQTLGRVFHPRFFNPFLGVWISHETLFLVFDLLLGTVIDEYVSQYDYLSKKMNIGEYLTQVIRENENKTKLCTNLLAIIQARSLLNLYTINL